MRVGEAVFGKGVKKDIASYDPQIEMSAREFGVDSDLIRGIIYEEQTHKIPGLESFYGEVFVGSTVGLGQITIGTSSVTANSRFELLDPTTNIRGIAEHLSHLASQSLIDPNRPIASLATRYNCGSCTTISEYGERVERYAEQFR